MTVKPLNLSILIGDMNRLSPQSSPRPVVLAPNNKKSRIPLATSQTLPGHDQRSSRGVTTFRQWADPPPPPIRSRTLDRKSSTPNKKRPGSADPRFRRSLETTKVCPTPQIEPIKQSSSFCELSASSMQDPKEKIKEIPSYIPQLDQIDNKIEFLKPVAQNLGDMDPVEIRHAHLRDLSPRDISPRDISPIQNRKHLRSAQYEAENEKFKNIEDIMSVYPLPAPYVKPKELEIKEIYNDRNNCDVQSESKYSQTDVYSTDYQQETMTEIAEQSEAPDDGNNENDILQFIARNYEKTSKFLDGIVLNRTRSISTVYELEPVNRRCKTKRSYGRVSRILLQQNYWTYVEIWAAVSFLAAILMFGWFYLVPYIFDAFYTWIYPRPPTTAMDYYRSSVGDIFYSTVDSFYNLLTTPANRRLS